MPEEIMARFDESFDRYDERDLTAIRGMAAIAPEAFRDDADTVFFARQLEYVKTRIYQRKYPALTGLSLVPTATDTPEYAETITTRWFDEVGIAKVIANYADDLPRADVRMKEVSVRVRTIGDSYGYNINEIRASRATGAGLDTKKAGAARRAIEQKLNRIALSGDADYGLFGLLNFPNLPDVSLTNGDWLNLLTTGDEILADLNQLWVALATQSKGVHVPNTLLMPPAHHARAATAPLTGMNGVTALGFWKLMHPNVAVREVQEFKDVGGVSGDDRIMLGEFVEENIRFELVMPFNQLNPQERNLEAVVPCMARTAGVNCDYPLAFVTSDDV